MSKHFRLLGSLAGRLENQGVPVPAVLRRAGLPADLFDQPRVLVATEPLFAFWKAVGELAPEPSVGLALAAQSCTAQFDPLILAALSSENFGAAVEQAARYKQLTCPEEIRSLVEGNEWCIQFRWIESDNLEPEVLTDLCFAWLLNLARQGTGAQLTPLRVDFVRHRSYAAALQAHFGCPIHDGVTANAIVFRATDAGRPFLTHNAELLALLAPQLDAELKQQHSQQSFAERVRATIQQRLTGRRPKVGEIARALHLSARTLQRRLQDDGSSFQKALEQARHQMARHYLRHSPLELGETAYLLGYEDVNSFVRAFRTWEGVPPAHWREQQ
jgi:AraC-like DNA-binding protein